MSKKLTPWFDGDVKPERVGLYERDYGQTKKTPITSMPLPDFWDGLAWRYVCNGDVCVVPSRRWRGLAKKPSAKP